MPSVMGKKKSKETAQSRKPEPRTVPREEHKCLRKEGEGKQKGKREQRKEGKAEEEKKDILSALIPTEPC